MRVVTFATNSDNLGFILLKASCALNGLKLTALVMCEDHYRNFRSKDQPFRDFLNELDDEEIVLFTDAYDTLMLADEDEILEKYRRFGKPLVFSAETCSWPDMEMEARYPKIDDSPHRFLNSGGFIGPAGVIRALHDQPLEDIDPRFAFSNQYLWALRYLKNMDDIALDTRCELFYPLYPAPGELPMFNLSEQSHLIEFAIRKRQWFGRNFEVKNHRLYSRVFDNWPSTVHFNGAGKCMMSPQMIHMILARVPGAELYTERNCDPVAEMASS